MAVKVKELLVVYEGADGTERVVRVSDPEGTVVDALVWSGTTFTRCIVNPDDPSKPPVVMPPGDVPPGVTIWPVSAQHADGGAQLEDGNGCIWIHRTNCTWYEWCDPGG